MAKNTKETETSPAAPTIAAAQTMSAALSPEGKVLSQEEIMRIIGGTLKEVKRVDAPLFYASNVLMMASGNDFTLLFNRPHPIEKADGSINVAAAVADTVAIVSITPQTAKDLFLLLRENIPKWEAEFGVVNTPFMRQLGIMNQKKD
jgi:hypothetical protein